MLTTVFNAFIATLKLTIFASLIAGICGVSLGFMLHNIKTKQVMLTKLAYYFLKLPLNLLNATPYIVIAIFTMGFFSYYAPYDHLTTGIVLLSLILTAMPMFTLITFEAIQKLPEELSETITALGASPKQAIFKIYLPEIMPSLTVGASNIMIQVLGFATLAGLFGGGGIGQLLVRKGLDGFNMRFVSCSALLLIAAVSTIQWLGRICATRMQHHN